MTVRASDGSLAATQPVSVGVTDVNEAPTSVTLSAYAVPAGSAGAAVGTLAGTDPDAGDALTFPVVNDAWFEAANGQLRLEGGVALSQPGQVVVDVRATDAGGLALTRSFTVTAEPAARRGRTEAVQPHDESDDVLRGGHEHLGFRMNRSPSVGHRSVSQTQ